MGASERSRGTVGEATAGTGDVGSTRRARASRSRRSEPGRYAKESGAVRLAYAEILPDERKETACSFMSRALGFFAERGVSIERVLTDNGSCYRSGAFARTLAEAGVAHRWTRPYRPQTNGKVERFNLTLKWEWAYARAYESNASRTEELERWLHHYHYHRPRMAHAGKAPITVLNNVPRKHT